MTGVLLSLSSEQFEIQGSQFVFITPVLTYPSISSAGTIFKTVWPQPLPLSSLAIAVEDANDLSPSLSSRKVLLLECSCGSYSSDMSTLSSLLRGSDFMIGSDGAVYVDNALIGFRSMSLRGSAAEISTAISALSWLPPDINGNCTLAMTLSKAMSNGIYSVGLNFTVAVTSPPRLTIELAQGIVIAEGSTLPLAHIISQLNDSSPTDSANYQLGMEVIVDSERLISSFSIVGTGISNIGAIIALKKGEWKGEKWI